MDYKSYRPEDFAKDENFLIWVLQPDRNREEFWNRWIIENPDKLKDINEAKQLVSSFKFQTFSPTEESLNRTWNKVFEEMKNLNIEKERKLSFSILKIAASITILLVSVFLLLIIINSPGEVIKTQYGENRTVTLPDGSEVVLNGNSLLSYSGNWKNKNDREVILEGEAFFNIKHLQSNKKFLVKSGGVEIVVLGTKFNVTNRHKKTKVVLNSGKVKIDLVSPNSHKEIFMAPGDMVDVDQNNFNYELRKVNPELHTSWKEKKLILDETPVHEIAQYLNDNYGVSIYFKDESIAKKEITGSLDIESIDGFLKALSIALDTEIEKKGEEIIVGD